MNETLHIIQAMKATGNRPGVIAQWKELVADWAGDTLRYDPKQSDAAAVKAWLPLWQPRPFYTAEELAPMWPALAIATGFTNKWPATIKSAQRLEHELDFAPVRYGENYRLPRLSYCRRYFIVERIHHWRRALDSEVMRELQNVLG